MAIAARRPTGPLFVRPYEDRDEQAVLALLAVDHLAGQPVATAAMLAEARSGRSPVDGGWWDQLDPPVTDVVQEGAGELLGVVSWAVRRHDGAGVILWLHCRENETVARILISHVLDLIGARTVYAFEFASALTLGLEGLPVRHRQATRRTLEAAGFTGRDRWRYLHAPLPVAGLPRAVGCTASPCEDPPGKRLEVREGGTPVAEAMVGCPVDGIGVLWWINVVPVARGRGLGRALFGSALNTLAGLGADQVVLYVDDGAPGDGERSRIPANRMYDRAGLTEIDRLWSFTRCL